MRDGLIEKGEYFVRSGKVIDYFPQPYVNEDASRLANHAAYPPDLSLIVLGRKEKEDYIFSLLTGYTDAPAGRDLQEGQNYNLYFPGGAFEQFIYSEQSGESTYFPFINRRWDSKIILFILAGYSFHMYHWAFATQKNHENCVLPG